jgi:hypothetical protein
LQQKQTGKSSDAPDFHFNTLLAPILIDQNLTVLIVHIIAVFNSLQFTTNSFIELNLQYLYN